MNVFDCRLGERKSWRQLNGLNTPNYTIVCYIYIYWRWQSSFPRRENNWQDSTWSGFLEAPYILLYDLEKTKQDTQKLDWKRCSPICFDIDKSILLAAITIAAHRESQHRGVMPNGTEVRKRAEVDGSIWRRTCHKCDGSWDHFVEGEGAAWRGNNDGKYLWYHLQSEVHVYVMWPNDCIMWRRSQKACTHATRLKLHLYEIYRFHTSDTIISRASRLLVRDQLRTNISGFLFNLTDWDHPPVAKELTTVVDPSDVQCIASTRGTRSSGLLR